MGKPFWHPFTPLHKLNSSLWSSNRCSWYHFHEPRNSRFTLQKWTELTVLERWRPYPGVCGSELRCKLRMRVCLHSPCRHVRVNTPLTKPPSSSPQLRRRDNNNPVSDICDVRRVTMETERATSGHLQHRNPIRLGTQSLAFSSESEDSMW